MGDTTFEVRYIYTIYNKKGQEEWTGDSLNGYNLSVVCERLKDQFVYACRIGAETKKWAIKNLEHDYYFIVEQCEKRSSFEILKTDTVILVCDETDAMGLKLSCV